MDFKIEWYLIEIDTKHCPIETICIKNKTTEYQKVKCNSLKFDFQAVAFHFLAIKSKSNEKW